jgi:hypothetical protein
MLRSSCRGTELARVCVAQQEVSRKQPVLTQPVSRVIRMQWLPAEPGRHSPCGAVRGQWATGLTHGNYDESRVTGLSWPWRVSWAAGVLSVALFFKLWATVYRLGLYTVDTHAALESLARCGSLSVQAKYSHWMSTCRGTGP